MEKLQSRSDKKWEGYKGGGVQPVEILPSVAPTVDDVMNKVINTKFNADDAVNHSGLEDILKQWREKEKGT